MFENRPTWCRESTSFRSFVRAARTATLALIAGAGAQAQLTWLGLSATGPSARGAHTMAYDEARGETVLFGGCDASGCFGDTWIWNGATWTQAVAPGGPAARYGHAMVYDRAREVVVLFGGGNFNTLFRDTWEWDGTGWLRVATTGPSPRWNMGIAYDHDRDKVVMFGGSNYQNAFRQTWEWDGTTWTRVSTTGPTSRISPGMSWDGNRRTVLMCGGMDIYAAMPLPRDTWEWDGTNWSQIPTPTFPLNYGGITIPVGLHGHSMTWVPSIQRVVQMGGTIAVKNVISGGPSAAWSWFDGDHWSGGQSGAPLVNAAAVAYDTAAENVVTFGGAQYYFYFGQGEANNHLGMTAVLESPNPGLFASLGGECIGSIGRPRLTPVDNQRPWSGLDFDLELSSLIPNTPAWVAFGASRNNLGAVPLPIELTPFGAPTCSLFTSSEVLIPLNTATGTGRTTIQFPMVPQYVGQSFYLQGLAIDPINALGLVTGDLTIARLGQP